MVVLVKRNFSENLRSILCACFCFGASLFFFITLAGLKIEDGDDKFFFFLLLFGGIFMLALAALLVFFIIRRCLQPTKVVLLNQSTKEFWIVNERHISVSEPSLFSGTEQRYYCVPVRDVIEINTVEPSETELQEGIYKDLHSRLEIKTKSRGTITVEGLENPKRDAERIKACQERVMSGQPIDGRF